MKPYLIPLFAVATLFPRLLALPAPLQQVQLTELLFLPILWLFRFDLWQQCRRFPLFSAAAAAYVFIGGTSAVWAASAGAILEASARGYLAVVSLLTAAHIYQYGAEKLARWWKWGTIITATAALAYYILIMLGVPDIANWVAGFQDYPYFGDVYRLRATGNTYGMWVMLLLPGLLLAWLDFRTGRSSLWPVGLLLVAILPTLSKEFLLAIAGLLLLAKLPPLIGRVLPMALMVVLVFGTHYLLVSSKTVGTSTSYQGEITSMALGSYKVVESVYLPIKRVAVRVGLDNPWLGVGPGQFARHSEAAARPGELPNNFGPFDPHSVWTGAFAETGIFGFIALILLFLVLLGHRPGDLTTIGGVLLLFLVASLFKDVMNFRGLWLLIGWYLVQGEGKREIGWVRAEGLP